MNCHPANQCNACKAEDEYMMTNNIPNDLTGVIVPHDESDTLPTHKGMEPAHTHDCEHCVYLGTAILYVNVYDFYFCPNGLGEIICRYGPIGHEYISADYKLAKAIAGDNTHLSPIYKYALEQYEKMWDSFAQDDPRCPYCDDNHCGGWCG